MEQPMDGPRIARELGASRVADREETLYRHLLPPTRTLVLKADLATLRGRKDDLDEILHGHKVDSVNALEEGPGRVTVDATRPYPEVLLDAKRAIWEAL